MNYNRLKRGVAVLAVGTLLTFSITGCTLFGSTTGSNNQSSNSTTASKTVDINDLFSDRDLDASYDATSPKITLSEGSITSDSENAKVSGNTVTITKAGTYIITGTSSDAQIVVDCDSDKVQLVLDNANITSSSATALYVKQADKVFITLADGSTNNITINSDSEKKDDSTIDGAIFAKDDITINGSGTLNVTSGKTNGIVGKDDLKIVSGTINVTSANHGIQGKDTISIKDPTITISAEKDGLNSNGTVSIVGGNVNIAKSNEGIEGQVINIAGGETNVTSTDDGLNAASADTDLSEDPMAVDENAIINISGGKLTVDTDNNGDGLDSNGSINISGGETYISGPTTDGNTAIDFGSECVVTGGTLVAAGSTGMVEAMSENSTQAVMTVNASSDNGTITVTDKSGNKIVEYTPNKTYACMIISSPELKVGETYTVTCGSTSEDITLENTVTSNVTATMKMGGSGGQGGPMGGKMGDFQPPTDENGNKKAPPEGFQNNGDMPTPPNGGQMNGKMGKQQK